MLTKKIKLHHSVTENGKLQLRQITKYIKDGKVTDTKYSEPYTPKDTNNMEGFDQKSKDIVTSITTPEVLSEFKTETQTITGTGIEEKITYDRVIYEDNKIAIRRITRIYDEGEEISKKYHRSWINPGDSIEGKDVMSKTVAKKLHTKEVVDNYKLKLSKNVEIR